jgi:hypothetical protein
MPTSRDLHIFIDTFACFEGVEISNCDFLPAEIGERITAVAFAALQKASAQNDNNNKTPEDTKATSGNAGVKQENQNSPGQKEGKLLWEIVSTDKETKLYLIDVNNKEIWPKGAIHYAFINMDGEFCMLTVKNKQPVDVTNKEIRTFKVLLEFEPGGNEAGKKAKNKKKLFRQIISMPLGGKNRFVGKESPGLEYLTKRRNSAHSVASDPDDFVWLNWWQTKPPLPKIPVQEKPLTKDKIKGGIWITAEIGGWPVKVKYYGDGKLSAFYLQADNPSDPDINNPIDENKLNPSDLAAARDYVKKVKKNLDELQKDTADSDFNKRLQKLIKDKNAEIDIATPVIDVNNPKGENKTEKEGRNSHIQYNPDNTVYVETGGYRAAKVGLAHELVGHAYNNATNHYTDEKIMDKDTVIKDDTGSGIPLEEESAMKWENIERAAIGEEQRKTWTGEDDNNVEHIYTVPDKCLVKKKTPNSPVKKKNK